MKCSEEVLFARFGEATQAMDRGDNALALKEFLRLAEEGYRYAFNSVGVLIEAGASRDIPKQDALKWYRRAARAGESCGAANLGTSYAALGRVALAKKWLSLAVAQGHHNAAVELGGLYLQSGKPEDRVQAKQVLQAAIASGVLMESQEDLARHMLQSIEGGVSVN